MHMFIDESGDAGIKLERTGTSPHFVVAGVIVQNTDAEQCRAGLTDFARTSGLKRGEFRFNKCDNRLKSAYLRAAVRYPWRYLAVVLNKQKLRSPGFQYKDSLYKYTVSLLMSNAQPYLSGAFVVFDQCGSRDFKRTMRTYVKRKTAREGVPEAIRRVSAVASHAEPLLQLADMVAGAVARSYKPELPDSRAYRAIIQPLELGVQFWPV